MLFQRVYCAVLSVWSVATVHAAPARIDLDLRPGAIRDPQGSYLPAEKYPFTALYTAEEMGYSTM